MDMKYTNSKDVFECLNGNTGLTEEFIYRNISNIKPQYRVLSGATINSRNLGFIPLCKGMNNEIIKTFTDKQGILVARKGKAGLMKFIETGLYTINDDAYILSLKNNFKDKYHIHDIKQEEKFLKWFIFKHQKDVIEYSSSSDNATWNKTRFFKTFKFIIPSFAEISCVAERYDKCLNLKDKLFTISDSIIELIGKTLSFDNITFNGMIAIKDIFSYISRNDSLSEEGIYNKCPQSKENDSITVLSGSTENIIYGKISSKTKGIHSLQEKQGLHLVTRGKAGKLTYIPKGTYATNTNAFILHIKNGAFKKISVKNEKEEEIYLNFMKIYLQPIFYDVSSQSDVSVFPLTEIMKSLKIPAFQYCNEMKVLVNKYFKLYNYFESILGMSNKIDNLMNKKFI